jgi:hypothetical protein
MPVFPEQRKSAGDVYKMLRSRRYCLFNAPMQWGKTGTYMCVAKCMLSKGHVDKVIIFSGNRENDLKEQTIQRAGNIAEVVWGPALTTFVPPKGKVLYIWDESHYCQSIGQSVDRFLSNCGLTPCSSRQNGNYLLSVSATPFSELHNIDPSYVVRAYVSSAYWSVKDMLYTGQIQFYSSFSESLLRLSSGYGLVRAQDSPTIKYESIVLHYAKKHNIHVIIYDMNFKGDLEHILSEMPDKPTFIMIKKRLQMGKTITNQQHVRFCLETSSHKNTDALLQGFIGRFSGYNTNHSTSIMVSEYSQEDLYRYINKDIPHKAANLRIKTNTTSKEIFSR